MNYHIHTFGCQMNVNDSEKIDFLLKKKGFKWSDSAEKADIVIINSCAVREKAQEKIFSFIGRLRKDQKIIVAGCVAQVEKEGILKRNNKIDFVVGTHQYYNIGEIIDDHVIKKNKGVLSGFSKNWEEVIPDIYSRESEVSGYISIMEGCNNFCTYCIVPFTRGREKYRPYENILEEAMFLSDKGYREIILLGQNVNSWNDPEKKMGFAELLDRLSINTNVEWIRFITSYPGYYESELIGVMKKHRKLARHIHFPVQSGSTRLLKKMGRIYSRKDYIDIVKKFREEIPGMKFSSDFIVGFPGETERDFKLTLSLMEKIRFDSIFSFIYSPRKHTKASLMKDNSGKEEKKRRLEVLHSLQKEIQIEEHRKLVGSKIKVLITGKNPKRPGEMAGRTESYKIVNFPSKKNVGEFTDVLIDRAGPYSFRGKEAG
ncbi:MAG: tRNA (N6-isopentenyl adenosine(37)-C2)-methylthiotransferase MiaB [Acidobacteriota bacterium]